MQPVVATRVMRALVDDEAYDAALAFGAVCADARFREACAPWTMRARDELSWRRAESEMLVYESSWASAPTRATLLHTARMMLAEGIRVRELLLRRAPRWLRRLREVAALTEDADAPEAAGEWDYYRQRLMCGWLSEAVERGGWREGGAEDAHPELLGFAAHRA